MCEGDLCGGGEMRAPCMCTNCQGTNVKHIAIKRGRVTSKVTHHHLPASTSKLLHVRGHLQTHTCRNTQLVDCLPTLCNPVVRKGLCIRQVREGTFLSA